MSKYETLNTTLTSQEHLVEALGTMGFHPVVHAIAEPLEGFEGGRRQETAEIVIPRRQVGSASNDIGFKRQPNGTFKAIISQYDRRQYNDEWLADLNVSTAVAHVTQMARRQYGCVKPVIKDIETSNGPKRVVKFILQ